jgi:hypothetical protein
MAEPELKDDIVVVDDTPEQAVPPVEEDDAPEQKTDGSVDSSDDEEEEKRKKKRRRGGNPQAKIKELWQREQDNKARIQQLEQEKLQSDQKAGRYHEIAVANAEAKLQSDKIRLEQELRVAHELADAGAIAKVTSALSQVQADEAQLKRHKMENFIDGRQPVSVRQQVEQPYSGNTLDDLYHNGTQATKKWLDENREWFDSDSDSFDEDRAADVTDFARNLERKLVQEGRAEEIQTTAYYRRINEYIRDNFSDEEEGEPQKKTFNRPSGGAAPVNSRSPNNQAKKPVTISLAEKQVALSLNLRHPNGVDYTDAEKLRAYVAGKKDTTKGL